MQTDLGLRIGAHSSDLVSISFNNSYLLPFILQHFHTSAFQYINTYVPQHFHTSAFQYISIYVPHNFHT